MAKNPTTVSTTTHAAQSVMARILATENIKVVIDPTMTTAAFDLKNRTLLLPQWKDMGKSVYDMLIGHEISHALHTPAEGWRETCVKIAGTDDTNSSAYRTASLYLNVVEDARIERMIQIKFPGFRRDFIAAYNELNAKNFFGVKGRDMNSLGFADRINLYYKLGTIGSVGINFTKQEDAFIRRIDNATSFEDAAQIAADLFKFCNEQQHKQQQTPPAPPQGATVNDNKVGDGQIDAGDSDSSDQQQDQQDSNNGKSNGDEGDEQQSQGNTPSQGNQPQQSDSKQPQSESKTPGSTGTQHSEGDVPPSPMTQENFNRNISQQVDKNEYRNKDLQAPTKLIHCNLSEIVIDCKKIVETARRDASFLFDPSVRSAAHTDIVNKFTAMQTKFMRDSKKQVDLLMKQFELRKAAQIAKRESVRKTGMLDTVRMVNYKFSEDIFRRNTMLPEGKNHGLVMFVDWSGSMSNCLEAVTEQTMVLVEFCRRMQIPYEVFAFTTRSFNDGADDNRWDDTSIARRNKLWKEEIGGNYDRSDRDTIMKNGYELPHSHSQFSLLNLLSSRMSRTEHQDMMMFLRAVVSRDNMTGTYFSLGTSRWDLSGTALDESIVAAMQIVPEFKQANGLDIVNTVFLTDGETSCPYVQGHQLIDPKTKAVYSGEQFMDENRTYGWSMSGHSTDILLLALRDITKSNVVGMYLSATSSNIQAQRWFREEFRRKTNMYAAGKSTKDRWAMQAAQREALSDLNKTVAKRFAEDNCVIAESGTTGYSEFYIIKSTARVLGDDTDPMDAVQAGATQAAVKKAFLKSFENKNKSRVLINRFMELIAR